MSQGPAVGDQAPDFSMPTDGGGSVSLSDLKGKPVVLYFYPKDFNKAGAVIIGTSADSVAKHDKFKAKHGLDIVLASDEDTKVCEAYGVWVEKNMYGKKYMGIERATYLIDPHGKIAQVWRKVKVPGHSDAVLAAVQAL